MKYVDKFRISNVIEKQYDPQFTDVDQLRFEKRVREKVAIRNLSYPTNLNHEEWDFYYSHGNYYVDKSTFYSELSYVSFNAVTNLHSKKEKKINLTIWTYGAVTVFFNGEKVANDDIPVYKPIKKHCFVVNAKKGDNELLILFQNLGVRDTRNLFGISYEEDEDIEFHVFGNKEDEIIATFLDNVVLEDHKLILPSKRDDIQLGFDMASPDYGKVKYRYSWEKLHPCTKVDIPKGNPYILLKINNLSRRFEIASEVIPIYSSIKDKDGNYKRMLGVIADAEGLSRGDKFGFYIQNILARKALGIEGKRDEEYFYETLNQIERRFDCSDFLISGVIRYLKNYEISPTLSMRIKEVLLNYRYWMTMEGSDAMCFWSENHSLLFYSCAMLVGQMYPDDYFPRAKMTGKELSEFGRRLTKEWMDDLEEYGFEEFLSTVYMNVTFACLLNIIDYADEEISKRAKNITDLMLRELALHTFKGCIIAPMGRVYRGVINPFKQGAQALMNLANPENPTSFGEGWLSYYATSSYQLPSDLIELMNNSQDKEYSTGDALIKLYKKDDYILTSVQSPRNDNFVRWHNVTLDKNPEKYLNTHLYTKSFNERFHGTTYFEPGTFGYQQHMWSVALSGEALVFANCPGASSDSSSMRPGYWYGNGIMPAVRQDGNMLASIFVLNDDYPIDFTHLYLPECKFEKVEKYENWIFLTLGEGKIAIWCNTKLSPYSDHLANCELRAYSQKSAYFVLACGREIDEKSFKENAIKLNPNFIEDKNILFVDGKEFISFTPSNDKTQYI